MEQPRLLQHSLGHAQVLLNLLGSVVMPGERRLQQHQPRGGRLSRSPLRVRQQARNPVLVPVQRL